MAKSTRSTDPKTITPSPNRLLTTEQVEEVFGVPTALLEQRRSIGGGPRFFKSGHSKTSIIRYRASDIDAWISDHLFETTAQVKGEKDHV